MSKHDDRRRITLDDVLMNKESLENLIRAREAEQEAKREAERLRKRSKNENEK